MHSDIPSPIDLRLISDAREWEQSASAKRPCRPEFFSRFVSEMAVASPPVRRVLELGSGPGFLAAHMLQALSGITCVLLDFSPAMHELARNRLGPLSKRVTFAERSFKELGWAEDLSTFDCVVTHQAVHELRHKRYAQALHAEVRAILNPGGFYLVCDHFCGEGGMENDQLYMSVEEQQVALSAAGFSQIAQLLNKGGLVLHRAE